MALNTMSTGGTTLQNPTVAFTTPPNYAARLSHILSLNAFKPLWCPTLIIQPTPFTLTPYLSPHSLDPFSAIAFTSRTAIQAFLQATDHLPQPPLSPSGPTFTVAALGKDSELLDRNFLSRICASPERAYETRWAGPKCAEGIVKASEEKGLDAVVFTSSAEVDGLLKSLREFGLGFGDLRRRCPRMVVAAHGPVTAAGAERLGVEVDVVSSKFDSFDGVVDVLNVTLARLRIQM
ncbi:Tetrapyrrole biosynthesis, uroporphyrinogen III synthase [Sesbania bispinosa]|nr:Tetrapyrrole biosynthesis, uroporphyrinogen III synthase [Sesbania bispinosa]